MLLLIPPAVECQPRNFSRRVEQGGETCLPFEKFFFGFASYSFLHIYFNKLTFSQTGFRSRPLLGRLRLGEFFSGSGNVSVNSIKKMIQTLWKAIPTKLITWLRPRAPPSALSSSIESAENLRELQRSVPAALFHAAYLGRVASPLLIISLRGGKIWVV